FLLLARNLSLISSLLTAASAISTLSLHDALPIWLEELGMDISETTGEFYEYLQAVKELDPVGGGETVPYGGTDIAEMVQWLSGSFGVMNRGPSNTNIDLDPENPDQVRFYAITDEYR